MKTISVKLPQSLLDELGAFARKKGLRRSTVIRTALTEHFANSRGFQKGSFADLARDIIGTCPGPRDLSTNPKYMRGYGK